MGSKSRRKAQRQTTAPSAPSPPRLTVEEELEQVLSQITVETNTLRNAAQRRDELVARARLLGASWTPIGRAADMTAQGAHSKWRQK